MYKQLGDIQKTPTIEIEEHNRAEDEMNSHAAALLRMMRLDNGRSGERIRHAMKTKGNKFAPLYCMRKDHKVIVPGKEKEGPKTRPVCGAKDCITRRTAYLLCQILAELIHPYETNCDSTDNLLKEIDRVNEGEVKKKWVVCSLDVEALYPSLDIQECAKVVEKKLIESNLKFEGLRWKEIALYTKYNMSV